MRAYSRQKSEKKKTKIWKIPELPSPTLDRFSYNCMCNHKGDHGMTVRDEIRDIKHKKEQKSGTLSLEIRFMSTKLKREMENEIRGEKSHP